MSGVTAKDSVREAVRAKVLAGECLIDGCNRTVTTRGLCDTHYQMFVRAISEKDSSDRVEFERIAIRDGLILAVGEQQRIKCGPNPFANVG